MAKVLNGITAYPMDQPPSASLATSKKTLSSCHRIASPQADIKSKVDHAANIARKAASYTAIWIARSLLFGALVSVIAAVLAREEDDREAAA
jgi:hypothetical protein